MTANPTLPEAQPFVPLDLPPAYRPMVDQAMRDYARAALAAQPEQVAQDSAYPSDVEIAVPAIGSEWGHSNGDTYTVIGYADMFSDNHQRKPPRIIYRSAKTGRVWSREHTDWHRAMKPVRAARASGKGDADKPHTS